MFAAEIVGVTARSMHIKQVRGAISFDLSVVSSDMRAHTPAHADIK
jgi:hypothetical protein